MVDIKYVIRMETIDVRINRPFYDTTSFEVYDIFGEAVKEYNHQIRCMQEDYVDGSWPDQESITIMSLYAAKVTQDCHPDPEKYVLIDLIHQTIGQFGSVKTFWATRQCEDNDDWEDCK